MIDFFRRNRELFLIFIAAGSLTATLMRLTNFFDIYKTYSLNTSILQFTGVLFGLFITAYAIFFGLVPALEKEVLKTRAFNESNKYFVYVLLMTVSIVLISLLIFFLPTQYQMFLAYFQFGLLLTVIFWSVLLTIILYYMIIHVRNTKING